MLNSPDIVIGLALAFGAGGVGGWLLGRRFCALSLKAARGQVEHLRAEYQRLHTNYRRTCRDLNEYKVREERYHASRSAAVSKGNATRRARRAAAKAGK